MSVRTRLIPLATVAVGILVAALSFSAPASAYPAGTSATLSVSTTTPSPGQSLTASGSNFAPGCSIDLTLQPSSADLGSTTSDANGNFSLTVTIPSDTSPGSYQIVASSACAASTAVAGITVVAAGAGGGGGGGGGGGLPNTGVAVLSIGGLGLVLLIGGGIMLYSGRRRRAVA